MKSGPAMKGSYVKSESWVMGTVTLTDCPPSQPSRMDGIFQELPVGWAVTLHGIASSCDLQPPNVVGSMARVAKDESAKCS